MNITINKQHLIDQIKVKKSFLCIGLDPVLSRIPECVEGENRIFAFNKALIDATHYLCVAYKPNLGFYLAQGVQGIEALEATIAYIKKYYPEIMVIFDAKIGDIGNTAEMYAEGCFNVFGADGATISPYMGEDAVKPFLQIPNKWAVVLALTSNKGAANFQMLETTNDERLFEEVLIQSRRWGTVDNLMYVVGATQAPMLADIREIAPDHFLLIPGVGAQGGSLEEVARYGMTNECGLLVNSSREIIFAGDDKLFDRKAAGKARNYQVLMEELLRKKGVI